MLSGELGEIYAVDAVFHNAYAPSGAWCHERRLSGGGCLIDLGVHLVDLTLWLLDASAVVSATGRRYRGGRRLSTDDEEVEDFATARLDLASGARYL